MTGIYFESKWTTELNFILKRIIDRISEVEESNALEVNTNHKSESGERMRYPKYLDILKTANISFPDPILFPEHL